MLEVITGPMFGGKSTILIQRLRRAELSRRKVVAFRPSIDDRYSESHLHTHVGAKFQATTLVAASDALSYEADVYGFDEAQFVGDDLPEVCETLVSRHKTVFVSGLDMDYAGVPFQVMSNLMARANVVTKVSAVCWTCGADAPRTKRISESQERIVIGGMSLYEAACYDHWRSS